MPAWTDRDLKVIEATIRLLEQEQDTGDRERSHVNAGACLTNFLLALGLKRVADAYDKVGKWYA